MKLTLIVALALPPWTAVAHELSSYAWKHECPQLEPLVPNDSEQLSGLDEYLGSKSFLQDSVARLSGAIQIDTTSQTS